MSDNTPKTDEQKVSYGFGLQFGQQLLRNQFSGLEAKFVAQGIEDILSKADVKVSEQELSEAYATVQAAMQKEQEQKAAKMRELGISFLAENEKRDEVTVTESGLQYEILEAGEGDKPSATDTVEVHYEGTFINGDVFDSSIARGEPATFGVNQVIAGWTEALQLMPVGSKWRLVIPSELAYGDAGAPPSIAGGSTLVFQVHLIKIC